jgi:signal transduction histidine kinase
LPGWLGLFLLVGMASTLIAQAASLPVAKVIQRYALTSANDFPQRDPQDWRLLASNDGGKTWATLDVRTNEFFQDRHQRRMFVFTNDTAFSLYRLQIDRVRNPAAADAVQLAQIEPLGNSADDFSPTPLFCDLITAQGDNPPTEASHQAFDDQIETKWLDTSVQHPGTRSSWIQWQYLDHTGLVVTNIAQLLSLRTRADEAYPVRIEGVFAGPIASVNQLCVLDNSGHFEFATGTAENNLTPGQTILVEGISQWQNDQVMIRHLKWQAIGPQAPERPKWIAPAEPVVLDKKFEWVETEGQVQFPTRTDHDLAFDLVENARSLSVHVLQADPSAIAPAAGTRVRLTGLADEVWDKNGNRVIGSLWTPSLDTVSDVSQTSAPTNSNSSPQTLTTNNWMPIDQIRHFSPAELARRPQVKIRGIVTELFGTCVQDGTGGIEIWMTGRTNITPQNLGAYIEVEGEAISAQGHGAAGYGPVVQVNQIHFLGNGKLPDPIRPSWSLLASGQMDAQWVEIDAVVRATDGSHLLLASENGQLMATIRSAAVADVKRLVDAGVRIRGISMAATDERGQMQGIQLVVPSLEFIQVRQPPGSGFAMTPRKIDSLFQVRGPNELIHKIKVAGVLTYFGNNNYFVQDSSGSVMAIAKQDVTLSLPAGGWWSFWQSPKVNTTPQRETELEVGDQVEVVGFPEMRSYAPALTEAIIHKVGGAKPVAPAKTTVAELAKGNLDSALVSLDGLVVGSETLETTFVLQIQADQKIFQVFLPVKGEEHFQIASGTKVKLTGICQMEPATHIELGKSPSAFALLLRDAHDITILERPPRLTARQALLAVGISIAILIGAFIWIRMLHQQVEVRTQQLKREIAEHEKTEALLDRKTQLLRLEIEEHKKTESTLAEKTISLEREIDERKNAQLEVEKIHRQLLTTSRMAGMADVATNVLHNVGNVLNGVNVLAASIATQIQKSKVPGVSRLAGLLAEHQADLGRFMTEDPNGQHVPGHLERLGTHLTEEQAKLIERSKLLTESIHHIKEIVAMQQGYAKASGIWETLPVSEIVEDALKMCSEAFIRHSIKLVRDYEETPAGTFDRHKVLQIVFNLLDNAKHAVSEMKESARQITIKIRRPGTGRVQIEVADNGMGIKPENLARIFTQGFSTRAKGHGFGLHSSILAAQDMGGSLTVGSDGPGKGANFTLELPLAAKNSTSRPG